MPHYVFRLHCPTWGSIPEWTEVFFFLKRKRKKGTWRSAKSLSLMGGEVNIIVRAGLSKMSLDTATSQSAKEKIVAQTSCLE